ncbi:MAG: hypothetical protein ACFCD0_26615 [Gemmataceae bacterium]
MFDQVYENMQRAANTTLQMQQEMFKRWLDLWSNHAPPSAPGFDQFQQFQENWVRTTKNLLQQQQQSLEKQFQAGMKSIETAFEAAKDTDLDELRKKNLELWKKNFDCLQLTYETQLKDMQNLVNKWTEIMTKGAA